MPPLLRLACARSFRPVHTLLRIHTEDQPERHVIAVRQLHNHIHDLPRIAFRTSFETSEQLEHRTDRGYSGSRCGAFCTARRAQLVRIPPGSSVQTLTPNGATSIARASLKPPTAHFAA